MTISNVKVTIKIDCQKLIEAIVDVLSKLDQIDSELIKIEIVKE